MQFADDGGDKLGSTGWTTNVIAIRVTNESDDHVAQFNAFAPGPGDKQLITIYHSLCSVIAWSRLPACTGLCGPAGLCQSAATAGWLLVWSQAAKAAWPAINLTFDDERSSKAQAKGGKGREETTKQSTFTLNLH